VRAVKSAAVDAAGSEVPKAPRAVAKKVLTMREDKALRQVEVRGDPLKMTHRAFFE
jgi:hypothetical protein